MPKEAVISVRNVRYKYPTSLDWILRTISLDVYRGEFLGIVGTTGAGKTTLCQCFNGLIPHYTLGTYEGRVVVEGRNTRETDVSDLSTMVGLVFQDADAQLVMSSVLEEAMLGLSMRGIPTHEAKEQAFHTLEAMGITHLADRPPHTLSGGQKQRAAIAAVMTMQPDILVLDEATSELDSQTVHRIFDMCQHLNEQGTTIVLVSHEMELLSQFADRLVLVDDGQVMLEGPPREVFQQAEIFHHVGVRLPQLTDFALAMADQLPFDLIPLTTDEAATVIRSAAGDTP
jgi:energy-coupling factor transport system ATP-binding protein